MVKTRGGFDRGMPSSHTPSTKRRSSRSLTSKQGQESHTDPAVPLIAKPLNVVIPPDFNVPSENSSSSDDSSDSDQNPKETAEEIAIEEESTPPEIPVPVHQTQIGESSKTKSPPTQEDMAAMLAAVHKLIDEMTEKSTPASQPVSSPTTETTPSQPKDGSSIPLSSSVQEKSAHPTEFVPREFVMS